MFSWFLSEELHHDLWIAAGKDNLEMVDRFLSLGVPPDVHGQGFYKLYISIFSDFT